MLLDVIRKMRLRPCFLILALVASIVLALVHLLPGLRTTSLHDRRYIAAGGHCHAVAYSLEEYIRDSGGPTQVHPPDFVKYICKQRHVYSSDGPPEAYASPTDVGVFLMLPTESQTDNLVIIGYSTPVTPGKDKSYQWLFFLGGTDLAAVALRESVASRILGKRMRESDTPDLYVWTGRYRYLEDRQEEQ